MIKKITASLATAGLALALILSLILPNTAFADETGTDKVNAATAQPTIQITDARSDDVFTVYKVMDITATGGYTLSTDFTNYLADDTSNKTAVKNIADYQALADETTIKNLLGGFAAYCVKNNVGAAYTINGTTKTNVALGQYVITGASTGPTAYVYAVMTASFPVVYNNDTKQYEVNQTVTLSSKRTQPTIDKEITDKVGQDKDDQVAIGDTVNYQIVTTIPTYPVDAINKTYQIGDTLTVGLTGHNNIKVYGVAPGAAVGANDTELTLNDQYTVDTNDGTNLLLNFTYDKIKQYGSIRVTYNSKVTADVVYGTEGNPNTAKLIYSNNPYSNTDSKSEPEDKEKVYSFKIKALKKDADTNTPLANVHFELYSDQACTQRVKLVNTNGVYKVDNTNGTQDVTLITGADGLVKVEGLDVGTYYLKEVQAAPGYHLPTGDAAKFAVTITDADHNGIVDGGTTEEASIDMTNKKVDTTLPQTGGMGTTIFIIVGISGMAAAVILLAVNKKRAKNN